MKTFFKIILKFITFSSICLSLLIFSGSLIAYAADADADGDDLPESSSSETSASSCDNKASVCLGVLTEKMCTDKSLLNGTFSDTDKICSVPEEKFTLVKYLGAWLNHLLLPVGIAVSIVLIIIAGILYMISGADPGKASLAKDIIFTVFIGLAFLLLARVIFGWVIG